MKPILPEKQHLLDWRDDLAVVTHGYPLSQQILRTDVSGMPLEWVDYREAARLYHTEQVAYTCGTLLYRLYGGTCARTGLRTIVDVNSIIATLGTSGNPGNLRGASYTPPLNNQTLFRRDAYLCLYCGARFPYSLLSRDHVTPFSRGGHDTWSNVGRRVLADQMEYLIAHFPRSSPLHERMQRWPM
jgi:hypothetical protein